jgi:hypothetical protein
MSWQRQSSLFSLIFGFILVGLTYGEDGIASRGDCSPCESEACGDCFAGCCESLWTVRADGVFLHRANSRNRVLVTDQFASGGTVLLNANELNPGFSEGWDVSIIRKNVLDTCWDIEGIYYSVDNWNASRGVVRSPSGAWVQYQNPLGNGFFPSDISADYHSGLHNVELNARREIGEWGALVIGFRYLDLRENGMTIFQTIVASPPNPAQHNVSSENNLTGAQIGLDGHIFSRGKLTVDGLVKGGVFNNSASNRVLITENAGPGFQSAAHVDHSAFVAEMTFTGVYSLNDHWSCRAGYQLLWIENVALAYDQVAVSDPANSTASVNTNGCPFYQGIILGMECNY